MREAKERQEEDYKAPKQKIADVEELAEYRLKKRKEYEDLIRRVFWNESVGRLHSPPQSPRSKPGARPCSGAGSEATDTKLYTKPTRIKDLSGPTRRSGSSMRNGRSRRRTSSDRGPSGSARWCTTTAAPRSGSSMRRWR